MTGLMAVVRALRFHDPEESFLRDIPQQDWRRLLEQTDAARLTLPVGIRREALLPEAVRTRISGDLARNAVRHQRLRTDLVEIAQALKGRGIPFAVLKGAAHWPYFCDLPEHRPQHDIDLFCPVPDAARKAIEHLGFEPFAGQKEGPVDHLPVMVRRTEWRWRGDYYDPEQPPFVEVHFRFWNPKRECFDVEGAERFWERRTERDCGGLDLPALSLPDTLSYAGLHAMRHLLRGDLRLYHMYELAHFLERSASDGEFWGAWANDTPPSFRALQGIAFRLASLWFHCRRHAVAEQAAENLSDPIREWCDRCAFSPVTALDRPNKDELLLHLCLVRNAAGRRRILANRLIPRSARRWNWRFAASRAAHHARALLSFSGSLIRWIARERPSLRNRIPPAGSVAE